MLRLDELDQAEALALDDLALAPGDEPVDLARARGRPARRPGRARSRAGRDQLSISSRPSPAVSAASFWRALGRVGALAEDAER